MAKKLVAVTGIRHNGESFDAGEPIDPSKFSKEELKELHDNGAIVVEDDAKPEELTPEELGQQGAQMQDVSAAAKESTAATVNAPKDATAKK